MEIEKDVPERNGARRGIQSFDIGLSVLEAFVAAQGPLTLTQLGETLGMPASKLHRYVSSLVSAGFLDQPRRSGAYDLGPRALAVGLAALNRNDFVNRAASATEELVARTGVTGTIAVWGNYGPTLVRWERGTDALTTALGLGSVMDLFRSATGRIFAAYLPEGSVKAFLSSGIGVASGAVNAEIDFALLDRMRGEIRRIGYASADGEYIPGLYAASAPVLNWQGDVEVAVTLVGRSNAVTDPEGKILPLLIETARNLSVLDPASGT